MRHRAFPDAWTRCGLHYDGFVCRLRAAAALFRVASPFAIADADVDADAESGDSRVGAMTRLFDVLEVVRAFAAPLVVIKRQGRRTEIGLEVGTDNGVDWLV